MSSSVASTPSVTPTVITVDNYTTLATAILDINNSQSGNYVIDLAPTFGDTITLSSDLPLLNAGDATVTIDGGGATIDGLGEFRGLFVQSGNVTLDDLTIADAVAAGGAGGSGIGGGGGGAGLGGGLFVGAGATVDLSDVSFTDDSALGGAGGVADLNATAGGGGGGMGGTGGAGEASIIAGLLNVVGGGGGGGGLGTGASGGGVLSGPGTGDAPGQAGGGQGGGQVQTVVDTYVFNLYETSPHDDVTDPISGALFGGGGGAGAVQFAGGGGGGIGGQSALTYDSGQVDYVDKTSELESVLEEVYSYAKIVLPILAPEIGVAFAILQLADDVYNVAESGDFTLADAAELGNDALNAGISVVGAASAAKEVKSSLSLTEKIENAVGTLRSVVQGNLPAVYGEGLTLAALAKKALSLAAKQAVKFGEAADTNLANGDPLGVSLELAGKSLDPLAGQSSDPTETSSTSFVFGVPTAGGDGGFGGGGGGGAGVGGNGGYGGGGGGAGLPTTDDDFSAAMAASAAAAAAAASMPRAGPAGSGPATAPTAIITKLRTMNTFRWRRKAAAGWAPAAASSFRRAARSSSAAASASPTTVRRAARATTAASAWATTFLRPAAAT